MLFDLILLLHSQNIYSGEFEIAGGKACTPSTSGIQGSLTWLHQSHVSFSPLRSLAPSWRIQMFRNGEMSVVRMEVQSPFCSWGSWIQAAKIAASRPSRPKALFSAR